MSISPIAIQLEASRRLSNEIALQKHYQQLERSKIQKELQILRRSRKNFIDGQMNQSKLQYEQKLKQDIDVSQEHFDRKKKSNAQRSKMAQYDFQRQRQRLIQQRQAYQNLERQLRVISKTLTQLQSRSKIAKQDQQRKILELSCRKNTILNQIQQSKKREFFHFQRAKKLSIS